MLTKPIASGVMLTAIIVLGGGAMLQSDSTEAARTATVIPDVAVETSETADEAPERTATAPGRVVESAGFPVVPESESEEVAAAPARPIVTVNGRPVDGQPTPAASTPATKPAAVAEAEEETPEPQPAKEAPEAGAAKPEQQTEVAVIEPPRPIPRPEGLTVPRSQAIDYDAIAEIAYGNRGVVPETQGFMSLEERRALAPIPGEEPLEPYDPRREGLVAVVGPDGEPIWIYEDQVRGQAAPDSGVTFQTRRVQSHPYGFVYDEYGW